MIFGSEEASQVPGLHATIHHIYRLALHRVPSSDECEVWANEVRSQRLSVAGLFETIASSPEAKQVGLRIQIAPTVPNGQLIQFAYEFLLGRGAMAAEIEQWDFRMRCHGLSRAEFSASLFSDRAARALTPDKVSPVHDPGVAHVMGTARFIKASEWQEKAHKLPDEVPPAPSQTYSSLRTSYQPGEIVVSAIASLYRGGEYIEQFMENITSQTIFANSELIIIDADSPENEIAVISRYMERFPNIVYHRASTRIGIYEAWNLGVHMSKGRYLTNTNLDDLRRIDSFERQAEILDKFGFVDVAYQDFYYSFEGKASFERSAAVGVRSEVPVLTPYNLMQSNSPHNAPMWRRSVHSDVGLFNADFRSAGDYDFWLRCWNAKKTFYKINDAHVIYYVNPEGLSTQADTRGIDEANRITLEYGRKLVSPWIVSDDDAFLNHVASRLGEDFEMPEGERASFDWRYLAVQRALRQLSVASRA